MIVIRRSIGRLLPLAVFLALIPLGSLAQTPPPPPPAAAMGIPGLTLSPAQQARFNTRNAKFTQDVEALKANPKLTPAQKQAKFVTLYKAVDKDMMAILTPTQRALVTKQRAQTQARAEAFQKAHGAQIKEGLALAEKLNKALTKDQQTHIGVITQAAQKQKEQIEQDASLSPEAKQQKSLAVDTDAQAKVLAVLTPSQRTMFTRMMQLRKAVAAGAAEGH